MATITDNDTIFLQSPEIKLTCQNGQLQILRHTQLIDSFPVVPLRQIVVLGNSQITTQAIKACMKEGIEILYFSAYGNFLGMLAPYSIKNASRKIAQYQTVSDPDLRLRWAKAIIHAKIKSCEVEYRRLTDNHWAQKQENFLPLCRAAHHDLDDAETTDEVMGIEGWVAKAYFPILGEALPEDIPWESRRYHPATDGINALLSFGYGFARGMLTAECRRRGLDPALGVFHANNRNNGALIDDLLELLRVTCVDHAVLKFLRTGRRTERGIPLRNGKLSPEFLRDVIDFLRQKRFSCWQKKIRGIFDISLHTLNTRAVPDFAVLEHLR